MRRLLVAMLAVLLSGCWFGYGLFTESDARVVLTPGVYRLAEPGRASHDVRIAILPSGMTRLDDPESDDGDAVYGFVPLAGSNRFLVWMGKFGKPSEQLTQIYFFGERRGAGSFAFFVPSCADEDGQIAVAAGAVIESGSAPSCRFPNKAAVLRALAQVRPNQRDTLVLTKVR